MPQTPKKSMNLEKVIKMTIFEMSRNVAELLILQIIKVGKWQNLEVVLKLKSCAENTG